MERKLIFLVLFATMLLFSCKQEEVKTFGAATPKDFDSSILVVKAPIYKGVKGQLVYLPVYSNIPFVIKNQEYITDMSAIVAIHNTDLANKITLTQVLYFDTEGKLIHDFLNGEKSTLNPLATVDYYVPFEDNSGTGANFLIEWVSDSLVNEPLIESITAKLTTNQSAAFINQGKIIREIK